MIDSLVCAHPANGDLFECIGVTADALSAARIREKFAGWLQRHFGLDPVRSSDLVLSINEALANVAEYAYVADRRRGTVDVRASYDPDDAKLTVVIDDGGVWQLPDTSGASRTRGRGIPLMRALSDRFSIDTSSAGTRVRLEWDDVPRPEGVGQERQGR
jgi:anti-sigma regulatory factor (Ser/Thr protein kinase)